MNMHWNNPEFGHFERVQNKRAKHGLTHGLLLLEELIGSFPIVGGDETLYLGISPETFNTLSDDHKVELLRCRFWMSDENTDSYALLNYHGDDYDAIGNFVSYGG